MSVLVTNEEIQISLSGDIGDWEDGGSLDGSGSGDGGGDDSQTLSYGGVTYRTTTVGETVWMAENLRYVPDEALLTKGIWYPDGNEDAEYVREHGMLYSFTAALGGAPGRFRRSGPGNLPCGLACTLYRRTANAGRGFRFRIYARRHVEFRFK